MARLKSHRAIVDMVIFAMLGALLFASKIAFEALPNVHPMTMLIMVYTLVFGIKAMIPTLIGMVLIGAINGFNIWWVPYLYIFPLYVLLTLALPKRMPHGVAAVVYPIVCGLFGFAFGTLYAPAQALMFHYSFKTTLAWIAAGLSFDILHGIGNAAMGLLVLPLSIIAKRLYAKIR